MVVGRQASCSKGVRLWLIQHAERTARLHPERAYGADHGKHRLEGRAVRNLAPRGAHAEPGSALLARPRGGVGHLGESQQIGSSHVRPVVRRLRTVRAILRTAARLDAEQHAALHFVGAIPRAMDALRVKNQIRQRRRVDVLDFGDRPVVTDRRDQ